MREKLGPLRDLQLHLRDFENQFDTAQGNLRNAGSLWALAGLGGIGGATAVNASALFGGMAPEGLGTQTLVALVSLLVIIGLCNLWQLDQFVYQRLLHSVYAFGMLLEDELPPVERVRQAINARVDDVTHGLSSFYALPIITYAVIFLFADIVQLAVGGCALFIVLSLIFAACMRWAFRLWTESRKNDVHEAKGVIGKAISEWKQSAAGDEDTEV
jgi:hypothetical protein